MFANPLTRMAIGIPLAIIMTLARFHLMRFFISADFEEPENLREYNLESITPEAQEEDAATTLSVTNRRHESLERN